jgi:DNA-binding NarL/FixJ family response regulator
MTDCPIRVLVADDHALVREGIRKVIDDPGRMVVVGEAADGDEALERVAELSPDVIVLDVTMPGRSGLEVTRELVEKHPQLRILILTMHDKQEYVLDAVRAGAHGYVLKDGEPAELQRAIDIVHKGDAYYTPWATSQISAALRGNARASATEGLQKLSSREVEILREVARGHTSKEIGEAFGISPRTVESHRLRLMDKLEIRSVAGLTKFAIQEGLVEAK